MKDIKRIMLIVIYLLILPRYCHSIQFMLPANHVKCIREEIQKNVLVMGDIYVVEHLVLEVDYVVTDSRDNILSKKENIKGPVKFSVVTDINDMIEVCFRAKPLLVSNRVFSSEISLILNRSDGPEKLNGTAEAEHLKPIEAKFKKIEKITSSILKDFSQLIENEWMNRNTNESTHFRVFYFSLVSIIILMGLALWQVLYLRRYFRVKKLIE